MPTFTYKAKDASGRTKTGNITVRDKQEVLFNLRQQNLFVVSVKQSAGQRTFLFAPKRQKVSTEQLALFFRQLSTLVNAGIPLTRGLTILAGQFKDKEIRQIIGSLCGYIEGGSSLSDALCNYPQVFSSLHINMVSAGESSGALSEILERTAVYIEKNNRLLCRVKSAMIYPAAILIVAILVISFLVFKIIPGFNEIFKSLGAELPLPTRILVGFSNVCRKYFLFLGIILAGIFLGTVRYINTPRGRVGFAALKLKLLVFGQLFQKLAIARFARTLSTLLASGIPILHALEIVAKTVGNEIIQIAIMRVREQVSKGERISLQLGKEKVFPQMAVEMIGVGEETGELEMMLGKIGDFYEEQVDVAINSLMSMIEPMIIIFLGVVVGSIVVAMFLPILKITQLIGGH
ncbi:MAG: type II secretion system F family protein [Elusimicrobia bacterium]|nr:type II secretion system F family protein [Elusimicrobiota bacterium]